MKTIFYSMAFLSVFLFSCKEPTDFDLNLHYDDDVKLSGQILTTFNYPIPNAKVTIEGFESYTDIDGRFIISGLEANSLYSIRVSKTGYSEYNNTVRLNKNEQTFSASLTLDDVEDFKVVRCVDQEIIGGEEEENKISFGSETTAIFRPLISQYNGYAVNKAILKIAAFGFTSNYSDPTLNFVKLPSNLDFNNYLTAEDMSDFTILRSSSIPRQASTSNSPTITITVDITDDINNYLISNGNGIFGFYVNADMGLRITSLSLSIE